MGLKSAWAYHNGVRTMKLIKENAKSDLIGWVDGKYAERGYNDKLWIKTYANKKQCLAKIEKLNLDGVECRMSISHPFIIIKINS